MKKVILAGLLFSAVGTMSPGFPGSGLVSEGAQRTKAVLPGAVGAGAADCAAKHLNTSLKSDVTGVRQGVHHVLRVTNGAGGIMTGAGLWAQDGRATAFGATVSLFSILGMKLNNGTLTKK